ncbi:MAG: GNAT family N-acetyltransferase [Planctomycetota bacterium]
MRPDSPPKLTRPMIRVEAIRQPQRFIADPVAWDRLAAGVPFRRHAWLATWWRHFGQYESSIWLHATDESGSTVGLMPFMRRDTFEMVLPGQQALQWYGDGGVCSDHLAPLIAPGRVTDVATAMAKHLCEHADHPETRWTRLIMDGIACGDPASKAFLNALVDENASVHLSQRFHLWFNPVRSSWDDYIGAHSKRRRSLIRQMLRRLDEDPRWRIETASNTQQVDRFLDAMIRLHQRRWISRGEHGTYCCRAVIEFARDAAQRLLIADQLYLVALHHEDRIVAVEFHLKGSDQRLYCYSTGVDHQHPDSVGTMLNYHTLRKCHQDGWSGVDYLRGDEDYKVRLKAQPIPLLKANVFAPTRSARRWERIWKTGTWLKSHARRCRRRAAVHTLSLSDAFDGDHPLLPSPEALANAASCKPQEQGSQPIETPRDPNGDPEQPKAIALTLPATGTSATCDSSYV